MWPKETMIRRGEFEFLPEFKLSRALVVCFRAMPCGTFYIAFQLLTSVVYLPQAG